MPRPAATLPIPMPRKPPKDPRGGPRIAGPGKKIGRPRTSPGWTNVPVKVTLQTKADYKALPKAERSRLQLAMRLMIDEAITTAAKQ